MKRHIGTKSAAALGIVLLAAAGAAGASSNVPVLGRFQIACTDSKCYLVDTVTGQVWVSSAPDAFRAPKIDVSSPAVTAEASAYLGRWILPEDQSGEQGNIDIRPDGKVVVTVHGQEHQGSWTTEGNRIAIVFEDDNLVGEALPDGRLSLWERGGSDSPTALTRVPGDVQDPTPGLPAAASGLLGRWISNDPEADSFGLQLEADGLAVLTSDDRTYAGRWRTEGTLLRINLDSEEEELLGQLQPNGGLNVWVPADGGETISLRRAPGAEQPTAIAAPAGAAGFFGQWVCDEPDEEEITLRIEPGGRLVAIEDDGDIHDGSWKVQGTQLSMSFEDEEDIAGALLPDGRLLIWQENNKDERLTFKRVPPKQQEPAQQTSHTSGFLGPWISDEPEEGDLGLRIERGGKAIATEGEKHYDGQWRIEGSRLFLTVDDDEHVGQLLPDGRLSLWEDGNPDHRLIFKRPPTEAQVQDMTSAAIEAGFLGRWISADSSKDDLTLVIEPAGAAIATNKSKRYEGSWSLSGSRLMLRVEDDELTGEVTPDGRLTLQEEDGGDTVVFRRPAP